MQVLVEKDIILTRLDNEIALLNQKNGRYFSLNETGALAWEAICESSDTDSAINVILNHYDVDESALRADIGIFCSQLIKAGIMSPVN